MIYFIHESPQNLRIVYETIIKIEEGKKKNRFVYENFVDQDLRIKNMHEGTNFINLLSLIKVLG